MSKQLPITIEGVLYDSFYKKMSRSVFKEINFKILSCFEQTEITKPKLVHEFVLQLVHDDKRNFPNKEEMKFIRDNIKVHFYPNIAKIKKIKQTKEFIIKVYNPLRKHEMWSWEDYKP